MTTRHDHHGYTDAEAASFDRLLPEAEPVRPGWFRLPSLADSETFGTVTVRAADDIDAAYAGVDRLADGSAFWKS